MPLTLKTRVILWGRSASRCAFPNCKRELVMDATETDDESLVGEVCHIIGDSVDGPRGDSQFSQEQRDKYSNLILLCNVHHKLVDDQRVAYSSEILRECKREHETWVRESLTSYDSSKQRDLEVYASYIEQWCKFLDIDNWKSWSSNFMSSSGPCIRIETMNNLLKLQEWLFARIWPNRLIELEAAFKNFFLILSDLITVFDKHSKKQDDWCETERFYKLQWFAEEEYQRRAILYDAHIALVQDLALELTRAANFICDRVRQFIDPTFRLSEGVLLIMVDFASDLKSHTYRVEYIGEQRISQPYPGLANFLNARFSRDTHFGEESDNKVLSRHYSPIQM